MKKNKGSQMGHTEKKNLKSNLLCKQANIVCTLMFTLLFTLSETSIICIRDGGNTYVGVFSFKIPFFSFVLSLYFKLKTFYTLITTFNDDCQVPKSLLPFRVAGLPARVRSTDCESSSSPCSSSPSASQSLSSSKLLQVNMLLLLVFRIKNLLS
jgi:hypothetical protein